MMALLSRAFRFALDMVFPPVCAVCDGPLNGANLPVCPACFDSLEILGEKALRLRAGEYAFSEAVSAWNFCDKFQSLVHLLKYDNKRCIGKELAARMCGLLNKKDFAGIDVLVPVPIHHTRKRERGYNQAEIIGEVVAGWLGKPMVPKLLRRLRSTGTQTKLKKEERAKNISGAFKANGSAMMGKSVLLVDDVLTTGATVNECARVLRQAGAIEVRVLTAARVKNTAGRRESR
jgi:ComF family protein